MIGYAVITDVGVCQKNDDRVMINGKIISTGAIDGIFDAPVIATVCDGVGGYSFGDEAAEIASKIFAGLNGMLLTQSSVEDAVLDANVSVLTAQSKDREHGNMSSTVAGLYIDGGDFIAFNVGDSKIFRQRNSYLMQVSVDHTFLQESLDLGLFASKSEISEKDRHKITRCIGDKRRFQPSITVGKNRVFEGDVFLICSDGLSDVVSNEAIESILNEPMVLSEKCKKLFCAALQNGSQDNISVILLEVV